MWFDDDGHVGGHFGIRGFQIILNTTKVNKYFVGILNLWIVLPTKYTKLNVQ